MGTNKDKDYFKNLSQIDQISAGFRPMSMILSGYFNNLLEAKFTREEALTLCSQLQSYMFKIAFQNVWNDNDNNDGE